MKKRRYRQKLLAIGMGLVIAAAFSACSADDRPDLKFAPVSQLREDLRISAPIVRESYQLALANPEVLSNIPCYCGCVAIHQNVKECFVREVRADGTIIWDEMGIGCKICQDIVQDTRKLTRQGKTLAEIRAAIDQSYSRFGPPTNTPPVAPEG